MESRIGVAETYRAGLSYLLTFEFQFGDLHHVPLHLDSLAELWEPSEILVSADNTWLLVDYPIERSWLLPLRPGPLTSADLVEIVRATYQAIYLEDSRDESVWGVYGHSLDMLVLEYAQLAVDPDNRTIVVLGIGS